MRIESDEDCRAYRTRVFDFLWREVEPLVDGIERTGEFPAEELFPKFREHGLWGLIVPEAYGRARPRHAPLSAAPRRDVQGGGNRARHPPRPQQRRPGRVGLRHRGPEAALPAPPRDRRELHDLRHDRARRRQRRGRGPVGRARGRSLRPQRPQALHHQCPFRDLHLVCCRTRPEGGRDGFTALVVERGAPGFGIEPMPAMMGINGPPHGILGFRDTRVPADSMIGAEGDGLEVFLGELEPSRVFVAANSLGTAERALAIALHYARRRATFGRPISSRESVRARLADMAKSVYGLKVMLEDVAAKLDRGEGAALEASIVKLLGAETVMEVTDAALDVLGGRAYFESYPYPFERLYREACLNLLEEGTPSIQRLVIGRALLDEPTPLALTALGGAPHQPAGTDPALGGRPGHELG